MYPLRLSKKIFVICLVITLMGVSFLSILRNSNIAVAATAPTLLDVRIAAGADDAEQRTTNGKMYLDSSNIEFVNDPGTAKGDQMIGLRFNGISVPRGATITKAYLEFQVVEASSETTSLSLRGEAADNAAAFNTDQKNIAKRSKTSASMSWDNLPAWSTVGAKVQTPDLAQVVQEIVNRSGWKAGNSLAFIVDGSGRRVAGAFEASAANAALLHIEYIPPTSPTATATRLPATATATKLPATATATKLPATPTATATPPISFDPPPATATPVGPAPTTAPTTVPTAAPTTAPTTAPTIAPTIAPTSAPTPTSVPSTSGDYMIMSRSNLLALSYTSSAWNAMKIAADASAGTPDLCNQDNRTHPKVALAAALVYARGGNQAYADKAKNLILAAYPTQIDGCANAVLSLGRQLGAYVIAADLIRLNDAGFNNWLSAVRTRNIGGQSRWYVLRDTAYDSANNWGTFALASIIAADRFLGDKAALDKDWQVFSAYGVPHGWPFNKTSSYNEQWSCVATDSTGKLPIAINTACTKSGYNMDGAPVEDSSRTAFPTVGNYPAESAQGYVVQAMILQQAGYPAWSVNTSQVKRVAEFRARFNNLNYSSADYYVTWMTNKIYGLNQPTQPAGFGRIFGFTDWLFAP